MAGILKKSLLFHAQDWCVQVAKETHHEQPGLAPEICSTSDFTPPHRHRNLEVLQAGSSLLKDGERERFSVALVISETSDLRAQPLDLAAQARADGFAFCSFLWPISVPLEDGLSKGWLNEEQVRADGWKRRQS